MSEQNISKSGNLKEVAGVFFKLGLIAFGGPAAHISMMEEEVVQKRKWMTPEHFLDLVGATSLIPGPNSTEMTMHCGHHRAGVAGLFVAGACFIFPAVVLTGLLAWLYVGYGTMPEFQPFFYGIQPAVLAIIIGAVYKLGKKALKGWELGLIGVLAITAYFFGAAEIYTILGAGIIGLLWLGLLRTKTMLSVFFPLLMMQAPEAAARRMGNLGIFLTFLKIGAVLFGSGYVLIGYLQGEIVETGWLTEQQVLDAVAMGQFTPGPVLSTATFIGYQLGGFGGAVLATIGIFLPSFLFVLILNPIVPKLRKSKLASGFLDGVNIGALAVMVAVTAELSFNALHDWKAIVIAALSLIVTFGYKKIGSVKTVIGGIVLGAALWYLEGSLLDTPLFRLLTF